MDVLLQREKYDITAFICYILAGNGGGGEELSAGPGRGHVSMRQLASSRLALELEREKERELDLRRLGLISTISEERRPLHQSQQLANGHVTAGGAWLVEREVQVAKQRELELQ